MQAKQQLTIKISAITFCISIFSVLISCSPTDQEQQPERPSKPKPNPESKLHQAPIMDISDKTQLVMISSNTDIEKKEYRATIKIKNISSTAIHSPLRVLIIEKNNFSMSPINPDGKTTDNIGYFNIPLKGKILQPGEESRHKVLNLRYKAGYRRKLIPFEYRIYGKLVASPLEPRSFPFALQASAKSHDVTFKVHTIEKMRVHPKKVILEQIGIGSANQHSFDCGLQNECRVSEKKHGGTNKQYKLYDNGKNGDRKANDSIYGATVKIKTDKYKAGDCLLFRAFIPIRKTKIKSTIYPLCITSFASDFVESNTSADNLVSLTKGSKTIADELLVRFTKHTPEETIKTTIDSVSATVVGSILPRYLFQIRFQSSITLEKLQAHIQTLKNKPEVESAYLNRLGQFASTPNDPEFSNQHGLQHIRADDAWDTGATGSGVTVTILDSGISSHTDLPISSGTDTVDHGTAVAGVVAAITNNSTGIAGVARDSTLEGFTVSSDAAVSIAEMVSGFQTVASSGTGAVVNASFSISSAPPPSDFPVPDQWDLCAAINDVVLNGSTPVAVVVSAAGNDGTDGWHYPAKCNDSTALANAMLTRKDLLITVLNSWSCNSGCTPDTRFSTSNYGAWIDVAAPGANIRSTNNAGSYSDFTGTSFSAPMVSGVAAQLLSCGMAIDQIEPTLITTAPTTVAYPGGSAPRVDALNAVAAASSSVPTDIIFSGTTAIDENTNTSGGLNLGSFTTIDPDGCDQHSYNIQPGADGAFFTIGGSNNDELIFDNGILDYETQIDYIVIVRTTDASSNVFDKIFTISTNDVNEAPTISNQAFNINENSSNGTSVGIVAASDPDAGDTLSFAITGGNIGNAFSINTSSGEITVNNSTAVDFETTPSFALIVQVTDSGLLNDSATVTITTNNINEAPSISNQTFNTNENSSNGTSVGIVAASDPDTGDTFSFAITGGNTGNAFAINSSSGEITVNNSSTLDFESTPSFALTVQVTDSGLLNDSATITVNLNNVNEAPSIGNQTFNINENSSSGTTVGTIAASDPDAGDSLTFAITGGNTGNGFAINASTGEITVDTVTALDFEVTPSFALTVQITDSSLLNDSATVTININNLNEAPNISPQTFNINENSANGTSVGVVVAIDFDAGDTTSYSITGGNTGNAFIINTSSGEITVNTSSALDFETTPSFALTVQATDSGLLSNSATITVNLNDINDPPSITNQTFNINENSSNGTSVGTVSANDPDAGDTISFAITAGNTGNAFAINSSSGEITVNNSTVIDFEITPSFGLNVEVTDSSLLSSSATITININNVNEAPTIGNQAFTIDENLPNGTSVGNVVASDPDTGDSLNFAITAGNTGSAFAINASSGEITVNTSSALDFETTPVFNLTVEVTDSGLLNDTATVTINLNDLPEGGPIPNPIIDWVTPVPFETYNDAFGNPYIRYRFEVTNRNLYPLAMFDPAPLLPPCGLNTNSSRTWVHIFNGATNAYIYGFCALGTPANMGSIWFAIPVGGTPPPSIYITLIDRQTSTTYTSNTLTVP